MKSTMSMSLLVTIQLPLLLVVTRAFQTPRCAIDTVSSVRFGSTTALLASRKPSSVTHQRGATRNDNSGMHKNKSRTSHKLSSISTADIGSYDIDDFIQESKRWKPTQATSPFAPTSKPQQKRMSEAKRVSKEAGRSHTLFVGNLSYGKCYIICLV